MSLWSACTEEEVIFYLMFMKDSRLEEKKFTYCIVNLCALDVNINNQLLLSLSLVDHDIKVMAGYQNAFIKYSTNYDHKLK